MNQEQEKFYRSIVMKINNILEDNLHSGGRDYAKDAQRLRNLEELAKASPLCTDKCLEELDMAYNQLKHRDDWEEIQAEFDRREASGYPLNAQQKDHYISTYFHGGC